MTFCKRSYDLTLYRPKSPTTDLPSLSHSHIQPSGPETDSGPVLCPVLTFALNLNQHLPSVQQHVLLPADVHRPGQLERGLDRPDHRRESSCEFLRLLSSLASLRLTSSLRLRRQLKALQDPSFTPTRQIFDEFALKGQVAVVSGAFGGLGLEMALSLVEQGCRRVYGLDMAPEPSSLSLNLLPGSRTTSLTR